MESSYTIFSKLNKTKNKANLLDLKQENCITNKEQICLAVPIVQQNQNKEMKFKKNLHQKLSQACQQVFQILLMLPQIQKEQVKSNFQKSKLLKNQNQYSLQFIQQYSPIIYFLHQQMNQHPKFYIKLKNLLQVPKIAAIFQTQIPFIYSTQAQNRAEQVQVVLLRTAIQQNSKRLWANYQQVRYLDINRYKKPTNNRLKLFYIDGLKSAMVNRNKILEMLGLSQQMRVQFIETLNKCQVQSDFFQSSEQQQIQQKEEQTNNLMEDEIELKRRDRVKNKKNLSYSAWICIGVEGDDQLEYINQKIKLVTDKLIKNRFYLEQKFNIQIQTQEEHEQNSQLQHILIDGFEKLSINPYIYHHQNYKQQTTDWKNLQKDKSTQLVFQYDNNLFFNF